MKYFLFAGCFLVCIGLTECESRDGKLTLVNTTTDTGFFSFSYHNDSSFSYPINTDKGKINYRESDVLFPKSEKPQIVMDTWEYFINKKCKDSTLIIFFIPKKLMDSVGKDSLMKYHLFSKSKKLKVKDLEELNWRVLF